MKPSTKNLFALIVGGFVGAVLRFEIGQWVPKPANGFPWSTLLINWLGCFFLGWVLTITLQKIILRPEIRLGLSTGLIGSFTTFSTFSVETVHLYISGHSIAAFLYVLLSAMGGLIWSISGVALARLHAEKPRGDLIV